MYEKHSEIKMIIESALSDSDMLKAKEYIDDYVAIAPNDMELTSYKAIYCIYTGNIEEAFDILIKGLIQYPLDDGINYNLAYVYEMNGNLEKAFEYYYRAYVLLGHYGNLKKREELGIDKKIDDLIKTIENNAVNEKTEEAKEKLRRINDKITNSCGLINKYFRDDRPCMGKSVWFSDFEKRYIAFQRPLFQSLISPEMCNLRHMKGELLKTTRSNRYIIGRDADEYLVPISTEDNSTVIQITEENDASVIVRPNYSQHFDYYRVHSGAAFASSKLVQFGEPVSLGHSHHRKKLVLNIFVDGLSQVILNGDDLRLTMPHTYEFFRRGIICTKAFSASEWTCPSLATYFTGLSTVNHMNYHSVLDNTLRTDVKTFFEYFNEQGYNTAKIDGDWRSTSALGHTRGVKRYIYQNSTIGMKQENMIGEVIEHLEAFKEADNCLWVCFDDLHNIADGLSNTVGVQRMMTLADHEIDETGKTSAKQNYSEKKISRYRKEAKHMDVLLNVLYHYIEDNYDDDEIVISLFADHGQGYLIKPNGHFIGLGRTNVAFMFRGGVGPSISDELISTCDYKKILCSLAGIKTEDELSDGNLPIVFGGEKSREWVLSESIHPGDPYYATYYTKDKIFYFENGYKTDNLGRFKIKDYKVFVEDYMGNSVDDEEFKQGYFELMMQHVAPLIIYED